MMTMTVIQMWRYNNFNKRQEMIGRCFLKIDLVRR